MIKLFSTKVHGMLDYGAAVLLLVVPRLLNFPANVTTLLTVLGLGIAVVSLVTRYELSIAKLLPMAGHLMIDGLAGALLLVAAYLFRDAGTTVWVTLLIFGLLELGAALMTDPVSSVEKSNAGDARAAATGSQTGNVRVYNDKR